MKKFLFCFITFFMIFPIADIYAENQVTEYNSTDYTQLIGYYFYKDNFRNFVKTPTIEFLENNNCLKINYSKEVQPTYCEDSEKIKIYYEYNYNHFHYIGGNREKHRTGFAVDGYLRFGWWMPIHSEFIDFVNSDDNLKNLIKADENTVIKNRFLFNKAY